MKWKNRKTAIVETVLLPYIGLLFALFLDQKCPHCGKYIKMSADVCPHCSKDIKTGKLVSIAANKVLNSSAESETKAGEAMCAPEAMSDASRAEEIRKLKEQIKSLERKRDAAGCVLLVGALIVGGVVIYLFCTDALSGRKAWRMFYMILIPLACLCKIVYDCGGLFNGEGNGKDALKLEALKVRLKELGKVDGKVKNENT